MRPPKERINEEIKETKITIDIAKKELHELGVPEHVQALQISSLNKRLQDLTKEKVNMYDSLTAENVDNVFKN